MKNLIEFHHCYGLLFLGDKQPLFSNNLLAKAYQRLQAMDFISTVLRAFNFTWS